MQNEVLFHPFFISKKFLAACEQSAYGLFQAWVHEAMSGFEGSETFSELHLAIENHAIYIHRQFRKLFVDR